MPNPSPLAHIVFFSLRDSSDESRQRFAELCKTHLPGHDGEIYFAVGTLAELAREVNDREFDVALHIVFDSRAAHDAYQTAPRHLKFVEQAKPLWKKVRVFDSNIVAD
jgi:quinol monooxygenase YgiN